MQSGTGTLSILGAVLIVLVFVLRAVLPRGLFIGMGSHFFHLNRIVFWLSLVAGLVIGMIRIVRAVASGRGIR